MLPNTKLYDYDDDGDGEALTHMVVCAIDISSGATHFFHSFGSIMTVKNNQTK